MKSLEDLDYEKIKCTLLLLCIYISRDLLNVFIVISLLSLLFFFIIIIINFIITIIRLLLFYYYSINARKVIQ